mgnify:FL=1
MSRDGSNIYSAPAGTLAVSGTTIESAKYNAFVNDLVADANLPRPVVAGGTGTSTAGGWLAAMDVTATAAELNTLDGITATVAELNVLDGIPGTLTATEIGYLDGVTSAIQAQLNAKQATITTLPLANGGTGVALADPGADRLMFWDDSAGATAYLTVGASLSITGTTLDATAEGATGAPVPSAAWHPYDMVNVGDGATGAFYDFAVDGVQATITAPTFVDGYDYLIRFVGLSHNGATHEFRANGVAVINSFASSNILTGYMELIAPTLTSWPKTAKSEFRVAVPGSLVWVTPATAVGSPPAMGFLTFPNLAAALTSVAFTWSGGSFDAGSAYLYRRRNFMFG